LINILTAIYTYHDTNNYIFYRKHRSRAQLQ
jgi:hypothetical protein